MAIFHSARDTYWVRPEERPAPPGRPAAAAKTPWQGFAACSTWRPTWADRRPNANADFARIRESAESRPGASSTPGWFSSDLTRRTHGTQEWADCGSTFVMAPCSTPSFAAEYDNRLRFARRPHSHFGAAVPSRFLHSFSQQ